MTSNSPQRDEIEDPSSELNSSTLPPGDHAAASATAHIAPSVMCAGMFSSGSTWAFNIVAQLLCKAYPGSRIAQTYADELFSEHEALASNADCLVFKTHAPSPATRLLARLGGLPIMLSIRDPRDAIASLMQRFSVTFDWALDKVVASSAALIQLRELPHLLLQYENGFTERDESVAQIAQHLGLRLPPGDVQNIFTAFTPNAVMATISDLQARHVIVGVEPAGAFDPQTHWHPGHVGDRRIGKWKESLTPPQAARVSYATRDFCTAFGYRDHDVPLAAGKPMYFSINGTGVKYLVSGFSDQEKWGVWTAHNCAIIRLRLEEPIHDSLTIELLCRLAPTLRRTETNTTARIRANGAGPLRIVADDQNPDHLIMCLNLKASEVNDDNSVEIRFEFDNLRSSAELGLESDVRLLGVGLLSLKISN